MKEAILDYLARVAVLALFVICLIITIGVIILPYYLIKIFDLHPFWVFVAFVVEATIIIPLFSMMPRDSLDKWDRPSSRPLRKW